MSDPLKISIDPPDAPEVAGAPATDVAGGDPTLPGGYGPAIVEAAVDEAKVRRLLTSFGAAAHRAGVHAVPEAELEPDWLAFTTAELDALVPPLTAYIAARPKLAQLAEQGDIAAVALALTAWTSRNAAAWSRIRTYRDPGDDDARDPRDLAREADLGPRGAPA